MFAVSAKQSRQRCKRLSDAATPSPRVGPESSPGQRVVQIAQSLGRHPESVRRVIRAVNVRDLMVALYPKPQQTGRPATFGERVVPGLVALMHQSPRELGFATERWTLWDLAAAYAANRYIVVVWDNAGWHKAAAVQLGLRQYNAAARREARPVIFLFPLPAYRPGLNPGEAIFNQIKRRVLFGRNFEDPTERRRTLDTHFAQRNARAQNADKAA